jgi:hypothetical protein
MILTMDARKNKWWHRLAVVIFWILAIGSIGIASLVSWDENRPYSITHIDDEKSYIACDKDKGTNLVYFFNKNGIYGEETTQTLASYSKDRATQVCSELSDDQQLLYSKKETALIEGGVWNYSERDALLQKYKESLVGTGDYTVHIVEATDNFGSWGAILTSELIILLVALILMYLTASTYSYILFGEKFKSPLSFWRKRTPL